MVTICKAKTGVKCDHKRNAVDLVYCSIEADKEKCKDAETELEYHEKINKRLDDLKKRGVR